MSEPLPEVRASDADRERVANRLRRAAGAGELTFEELDERLDDAYASRTLGQLKALTADLQPVDGGAFPEASRPDTFAVRRGEGGARWLVAIMSGCERKGRWRIAERCVNLNLMGGSTLDLNRAELASDHVELTVYSIMGGAEIRVPHGLNVEVTEFSVMGGNTADILEEHPAAGGPTLHLRLFSLMGGTEVKRGPKLSRSERKALERRQQG